MKRDWLVYFEDISDTIKRIEEFVRDRRTVDAAIRNFEFMREAAKYIPKEVRN